MKASGTMTDSVADSRSDFGNKGKEGQAINFALYTSPLPAQCTLVNSTVINLGQPVHPPTHCSPRRLSYWVVCITALTNTHLDNKHRQT